MSPSPLMRKIQGFIFIHADGTKRLQYFLLYSLCSGFLYSIRVEVIATMLASHHLPMKVSKLTLMLLS